MNILYLLPVISHARYNKRIGALNKLGTKSTILAFDRDYYPGKAFDSGYESLGRVQHRRYIKRIIPLVKAFFKIRRRIKDTDVVYTFGLDLLGMVWLSCIGQNKCPKIVYEVGDIRGVLLGRGLFAKCLRWLERFLLKRIDLLVVTSEAYVTGYYKKIQGLHSIKYHIIENKVDRDGMSCSVTQHKNKKENVIRIGYFGLIRCQRSWEILKKTVRMGNGGIRLYVRGIAMGIKNFEQEAEATPYVTYDGSYVYPDDLVDMYRQIDVSWIAHYHGKSNLLWSRANRFYEACFFKKPMFAQACTEDNRVVETLGLGVSIDLSDVEETVNHILNVTENELTQWRKNIVQLPTDVYIYTDEHEQLIKLIQ